MERTTEERLMAAAAYVIATLALLVALFFTPKPPEVTTVLGGATAAILLIGLIYCGRSRFVLIHALQAVLLHAVGCLIWLLPAVARAMGAARPEYHTLGYDAVLILAVLFCLGFKQALGGEIGRIWNWMLPRH